MQAIQNLINPLRQDAQSLFELNTTCLDGCEPALNGVVSCSQSVHNKVVIVVDGGVVGLDLRFQSADCLPMLDLG